MEKTENIEQQKVEVSTVSDSLVTKVETLKPTFRMALDSLVHLKYQYKLKEFREIPIDSASIVYRVNRDINNRGTDRIVTDNVPIQNIQSVQYSFLKGNSSRRTHIEEWTFDTEQGTKIIMDYIEKQKDKRTWIIISNKSPFSYFQIDNKLYVISTGGAYMYGEDEVLKEGLLQYLK
jgi:hypothetical protein